VPNRVFVHNTFAKYVLLGAGTAQSGSRLSCGLDSLAGARDSPPQYIQTGSDAHPASYSAGFP